MDLFVYSNKLEIRKVFSSKYGGYIEWTADISSFIVGRNDGHKELHMFAGEPEILKGKVFQTITVMEDVSDELLDDLLSRSDKIIFDKTGHTV